MTASSTTPLWLDLKKEYIDDNFEKLLVYLRDNSAKGNNDGFYKVTTDLLRERVRDLVQTLGISPVYGDDPDSNSTIFNVRLLATYLLLDEQNPLSLSAYVAMMRELMTLCPKFSDDIIHTAIKRLEHEKIANIAYTWNDITNFQTELFIYHVTNNNSFSIPLRKPILFENYGTALLSSKGIFLTPEKRSEAMKLLSSGASSLDTSIGVTLRTQSNEKFKQSEGSNIRLMDEYVKDFVLQLWKTKRKEVQTQPRHAEGDEVTVKVTSIDRNGTIYVETVGDRYERLQGEIRFYRPNILYYYVNDFSKYLRADDLLKANVKDADKGYFDIEDTFVRYVIEDCRKQYGTGEIVARLICKNANSLVWMNDRGTPLYSRMSDRYQIGDYALLQIQTYCTDNMYGKIQTTILEPLDDSEPFDTNEVQKECIIGFAEDTPVPANVVTEKDEQLSPNILRLLTRMFYEYQKTLLKPSERYHFLANARVMAEMTGDEQSAAYIKFCSTYLRVLVQFVNNESVADITLQPEKEFASARETLVRLSVLTILKEYGKKENSEILAKTIADFGDSIPVLARLARLIQTANSLQGTLSGAGINVIKREIIRALSLETENDTDLEADSGTYLGLESGTQEFKTSFVYPPNNNMQPNETAQELNVFRGVCAFMNSETGGTLYLGVNDQGYVVGLENDMKYLRFSEFDTYQRHVQDRAKHYFDTDGIMHLRMEPLYNNKVLAIHVEPHPYRVVELNKTAYLRVNAESREMPEKVKHEMIARKVFKDKNKAAAISMLQQACDQKLQVILHNYSSSNSGTVKDRKVEPFKIMPQEGFVMCCDCDNVSRASKIFNIDRIGYVEILADKPWEHERMHKEVPVDAFRWTGNTTINVSLKLDVTAKNLLVEEYPGTKSDLTQDRKDAGVWYLNTKVYNIMGIGRFYMGLANHIEIIDCPELKKYIEEYKKYL